MICATQRATQKVRMPENTSHLVLPNTTSSLQKKMEPLYNINLYVIFIYFLGFFSFLYCYRTRNFIPDDVLNELNLVLIFNIPISLTYIFATTTLFYFYFTPNYSYFFIFVVFFGAMILPVGIGVAVLFWLEKHYNVLSRYGRNKPDSTDDDTRGEGQQDDAK